MSLRNNDEFMKKYDASIGLCDKVVKDYIHLVYKKNNWITPKLQYSSGFKYEHDGVEEYIKFDIVDKDYMLDLSEHSEESNVRFSHIMTNMYHSLLLYAKMTYAGEKLSDNIDCIYADAKNTTFYFKTHENYPKRIGFVLVKEL